mmetsp:Transcript_40598/g.116124  ORF Transcript_40598/g.116124 Transcript_40598/m.116124 type:complete len:423 (-) Transcript_40598:392-1660(-)
MQGLGRREFDRRRPRPLEQRRHPLSSILPRRLQFPLQRLHRGLQRRHLQLQNVHLAFQSLPLLLEAPYFRNLLTDLQIGARLALMQFEQQSVKLFLWNSRKLWHCRSCGNCRCRSGCRLRSCSCSFSFDCALLELIPLALQVLAHVRLLFPVLLVLLVRRVQSVELGLQRQRRATHRRFQSVALGLQSFDHASHIFVPGIQHLHLGAAVLGLDHEAIPLGRGLDNEAISLGRSRVALTTCVLEVAPEYVALRPQLLDLAPQVCGLPGAGRGLGLCLNEPGLRLVACRADLRHEFRLQVFPLALQPCGAVLESFLSSECSLLLVFKLPLQMQNFHGKLGHLHLGSNHLSGRRARHTIRVASCILQGRPSMLFQNQLVDLLLQVALADCSLLELLLQGMDFFRGHPVHGMAGAAGHARALAHAL